MVWRNVDPFGNAETFSDTGSLFFQVAGSDWGTYSVPIDLDAPTALGAPTRLPTVNGELNSIADFSPDGRYLAYFQGGRLVLRELATESEREIPLGTTLLSPPHVDWCPSGDALLAAGYLAAGGGLGAFRVNVSDRSVQRLPFTPTNAYFPVLCLGDGREDIIYPAFKGNPWAVPGPLIRRSLVSGQETVLYKEAQAPVARSMDGRRLAFVTPEPNGTSRFRLVTMSTDGGAVSADLVPPDIKRRVNAQIQGAAWMPGGDRLIISLRDAPDSYNWAQMLQTPFSLWSVPLTDAAPRQLGSPPLRKVEGTFFGVGGLSVRPDGKMLTYQVDEGAIQQTWAIENLLQFIKAGGGK
jgi:hypothetical protein